MKPMNGDRKFFFPLEKDCPWEEVGSKCARLSRLYQEGFPIPKGIGVSHKLFLLLLEELGEKKAWENFQTLILKGEKEEAISQGEALRRAVLHKELPEKVRKIIHQVVWKLSFPLVVRSSALMEDTDRASFAGVFQSVLGVRTYQEAEQAFLSVWASLFSPLCVHYLAKLGKKPLLGMGILVQEQVQAELFGVLFASPKRYQIDLSKQPGGKVLHHLKAKSETEYHLESFEDSPPPSLDFLPPLLEIGKKLLQKYKTPQDVEWAWQNRIFLLQVRPVTVRSQAPAFWTSANSQEVLSQPATPMTQSFFLPMIERGRKALFLRLGIEEKFQGEEYLQFFYGRPYFNLTYFEKFLEQLGFLCPGLLETLVFGGKGDFPRFQVHWEKLTPAFFRLLWHSFPFLSRLPGILEKNQKAAEQLSQNSWVTRPPSTKEALLVYLHRLEKKVEYVLRLHVLGSALSALCFTALEMLAKDLPLTLREKESLFRGFPHLIPAKEGQSFWRLCQLANTLEVPPLKQEEALWHALRRLPQAGPFWLAFYEHLDWFGHRTLLEAELSIPRRREDPAKFLKAVLQSRGERKKREKQEERLRKRALHRLTGWKGALFRQVFSLFQLYFPYRDNLKDSALRLIYWVRQGILKLGEHFKRQRILREREDIFFLTYEELPRLVRGEQKGIERKIQKAKQLYEKWQKIQPPLFLSAKEEEKDEGKILWGIPASPGIAKGRVRLVTSPADLEKVESGEVLVLPAADPAILPFLPRLVGIVTDLGGLLSHSAILAREWGIPMVTGVKKATQVLRTGQRVVVDGHRGRVSLEEEE